MRGYMEIQKEHDIQTEWGHLRNSGLPGNSEKTLYSEKPVDLYRKDLGYPGLLEIHEN